MNLVRRVEEFLHNHPEVTFGQGIVAGVSGGPDSLTLLHLLRQLPENQRPHVWAAHLDHALRSESDDDARFVEHIANEWGFSAVIERRDVGAHATQHRLSIEEAGRQARYAFLAEVAQEHGANSILVAHNADDQAETVFMHLLRGSGLSGLRGMPALTPLSELHLPGQCGSELLLARPLLSTTRAEIIEYCASNGLVPCCDPSNSDLKILRNRLRYEILPELQSVNPNIHAALRRMADVAAAEHEVLCSVRDVAWEQTVIDVQDRQVTFDRVTFDGLLPGLRRSLIRTAIFLLRSDLRDVDYAPVAHAADFSLIAEVGQRTSLPGDLALAVEYDQIIIAPVGVSRAIPDEIPCLSPGETIALPVPGQEELPRCGWRAEADDLGRVSLETAIANSDHWLAYLDADRLPSPLSLRTRRVGDRFQPLGMHGHSQSVADFMIGARIPRSWRDHLPLLMTGDQIAWIPGWRLDHRIRVTESAQRVLRVRLVRGG